MLFARIAFGYELFTQLSFRQVLALQLDSKSAQLMLKQNYELLIEPCISIAHVNDAQWDRCYFNVSEDHVLSVVTTFHSDKLYTPTVHDESLHVAAKGKSINS